MSNLSYLTWPYSLWYGLKERMTIRYFHAFHPIFKPLVRKPFLKYPPPFFFSWCLQQRLFFIRITTFVAKQTRNQKCKNAVLLIVFSVKKELPRVTILILRYFKKYNNRTGPAYNAKIFQRNQNCLTFRFTHHRYIYMVTPTCISYFQRLQFTHCFVTDSAIHSFTKTSRKE